MLGEQVGEEKGRITGKRVLETTPQPKLEISFEGKGTILGIEHKSIGTYWSVMQPNGFLYGEGNGVIMTQEGHASWKGSGVGRITERGTTSYRGTVYYQTNVERLRRLNGIAVVFEYETDENDNTTSKSFEWK